MFFKRLTWLIIKVYNIIMDKLGKILEAINKTKATNVVKIDISKISSIADFFVIATCSSAVAVFSIADFVEQELKKISINIYKRNGKMGENWVILDFGDVVCHFFDEYTREFYNLEKLWGNANNIKYIKEEEQSEI